MSDTDGPMTLEKTVDAFHRGRFYLVQPKGRGHRAGIDAMLLASMVDAKGSVQVADLGAGAGAAGMAVAARLPQSAVSLFEMSEEMVAYATETLALAENQSLAPRVRLYQANVALQGNARKMAGLSDGVFDHVVMNPPFNDSSDRKTPDPLKQAAHAMDQDMFENWIRTAGAILKSGGQLSLIARPQSIADIIAACGRRFGGLEITPVHPHAEDNAFRVLVSGIKGSRARISMRAPIIVHETGSNAFRSLVDDLTNGRASYPRLGL